MHMLHYILYHVCDLHARRGHACRPARACLFAVPASLIIIIIIIIIIITIIIIIIIIQYIYIYIHTHIYIYI